MYRERGKYTTAIVLSRNRRRCLQLQMKEMLGDVSDVGDIFLDDESNGIEIRWIADGALLRQRESS